MTKRWTIQAVAIAGALAGAAVTWGQTPSGSAPTAATPGTRAPETPNSAVGTSTSAEVTDQFIKAAFQAGSEEVAAAQMAVGRSHSADVRSFAQKMLTDHGKANTRLKDLAAHEGVALPTDVDFAHMRLGIELQSKSGDAFDAIYARDMARDHEKAVTLFQQAAQNPKLDRDVRSFVQATLPTLQDHLTLANKLVAAHGGAS